LKEKYGYELGTTLHKDVPGNATNCGVEISLADYVLDSVPVIPIPVPTPDPTPTPVPDPTPEPQPQPLNEEAVIDDFLASIKEAHFRKK
jgi:hypothetical protein